MAISQRNKNVIKTVKPLADLIELTDEEEQAVKTAVKNKIAFGITPYYLSLMDPEVSQQDDHAIRAQVIPPQDYVNKLMEHHMDRQFSLDFMGEQDTSPVDLISGLNSGSTSGNILNGNTASLTPK